jgi:hypothetical protein
MPPPVDDRSALEGLVRQTCEEAIRFACLA